MEALIDKSPSTLLRRVAERARARRVALGLTRVVTAERAGVPVASLRQFETTGRIALDRLVRLAVVLEAEEAINALFPTTAIESIEDLDRAEQRRVRGIRRDAGRKRHTRGTT